MMPGRYRFSYLTIFYAVFILSVPHLSAQTFHFGPDAFVPQEDSFALPLVIEPGGLEVKGVESSITFNPALVKLDSISPGPWYTDSGQDFFFWDYTIPFTYTIHFASAILYSTNSNDGIIALCHFSFIDFGTCPLVFEDVDVRDMNNQVLQFSSDDGMIVLGSAAETDEVSFSSLKAIYR